MKVGYLPDQFGNISQAPQILLGFGIDNAIFGRGMHLDKDRGMEFWCGVAGRFPGARIAHGVLVQQCPTIPDRDG